MSKKREDVKIEDSWDLESLYKDFDAVKSDLKSAVEISKKLLGLKGKLSNKDTLLDFLKDYELMNIKLQNAVVYCSNKLNENIGDNDANALMGYYADMETKTATNCSFFEPEITANADAISKYIDLPEFANFKNTLFRTLRNKPHILSEKEEELLASFNSIEESYSDIFGTLVNVDLKFGEVDVDGKKVPLTISNLSTFTISQDREIRRQATEKFKSKFEEYKNTLAQVFKSSIKQNIIYSKIRKFNNSLKASLFEKDIDESVYHNLTKTVKENLSPLHKYYKIRKDFFKFEDGLKIYDLNNSIVKDYKKVMPYDKAVDVIEKSLAPLGSEYISILKDGLTNQRWVDRYENDGKQSGAYSYSAYNGKHFIKMNYKEDDNLDSLYTLTHEGGHAMHSYYSNVSNNFFNSNYTIFEAEIASTFNECLLFEYLYKNETDKNVKIAFLEDKIQSIIGTLYRQTMFADFEYQVHKYQETEGELTADLIYNMYGDLSRLYYGDSVDIKNDTDYVGLRIPHFYSDYYVFQYATGISAAMYLSGKVLNGGKKELDDYLGFLKRGCTMFPIDNLKLAGVDMSKPEPIKEVLKQFAKYVDELETLVFEK